MKFLIFAAAVVGYFFYLGWRNKGYEHVCLKTKEIAEIGGCHKYECGVKYVDGSFGRENAPVVGQVKCTVYGSRIEWHWI
jgi:hypothetical protein